MSETATFDHYEVLTRDDGSLFELGRGGMGITYKALDTRLRVPVALKVINASYLKSEVARLRFVGEARSAAKLRNRHVASVFHLATKGDKLFYAMEFINGETVGALIKREGPFDPVIALKITAQVARALSAASRHGLVHRDIKPENIMLVEEDDEIVAKLIDFGLAKALAASDAGRAANLSTGGFIGTAHFGSPEQWEEKETDSRSDIYSLGVTLWYMLAGQVPFTGSMAQVMSQHLSKPPPFEKLEQSPPPIVGILRKMLAKDPSERFQTPVELRKAIEAMLEKLTGTETPPQAIKDLEISPQTGKNGANLKAVALAKSTDQKSVPIPSAPPPNQRALEPQEVFATLVDSAAVRPELGGIEPNTMIANRYRVAQSCGETNAGRVFRAYDTARMCQVRLIVLHPDAHGDNLAPRVIERDVEKFVAVRHPNLLGIFGFETVGGSSILVLEWTEGFSLLDVLRARQKLDADEALKLLNQAAEGVDYAISLGLDGLDFALHRIEFHFSQSVEKEKLLREPLGRWPEFALKLNPLRATSEIVNSQKSDGEQTIAGDAHQSTVADGRAEYIRALAEMTYEVLGGKRSLMASPGRGGPAPRYIPISTLSEQGNEVLRRALDPERSFLSAREFSAGLAERNGLALRRKEPKRVLSETAEKGTPCPPALWVARPSKNPPIALIAVFAAVMVGAGIVFFHYPGGDIGRPATAASTTQTSASQGLSPGGSGSDTAASVSASAPKSEPAAGALVPEVPASNTRPNDPNREEAINAAINAAQALDEKASWSRSLDAWLRVAKDYPESPAVRVHLETLLSNVRSRPGPIASDEFERLRKQITEAAEFDSVSAMLLLGDNLRKSQPREAFDWYSKAAAEGNATAETLVGSMLSRGEGMSQPDPEEAFKHFQAAAGKGDIDGKFALGDCYRLGSGVPKDARRAVELLGEAAAAGDTRAMTHLGDCYVRGEGVKQDYDKAFTLFAKAKERGNLNAAGNLGVLYMNGQGVPANPQKAAELFATGARGGDSVCMRFYAHCFEIGKGVPKDPIQAAEWYRKAANAGNTNAIDWLNRHGVPFSPDR